MTIRYECPECSSVLKIKDEKAGQQGKCPKCKNTFTIPESSPAPEPILTADDLIDMPLELTPVAVIPKESLTASDEFDPMGVLNSDSASGGVPSSPGDLKPSVADLMREHQEKRARDEARRAKRQQKKVNPLLNDVETSGSAADAITRTYEKKREETSDAPPMSREERRAAEQRSAMLRFSVQLGGVLLVTVAFGYLLLSWALGGSSADVVEVTGRVTANNQPLAGYRIRFTPIQEINGPPLAGGPSSAKISSNGDFILLYKPNVAGAIVGLHEVTLEDSFGLQKQVPEEFSEREVTADGENHFEFNF